MDLRKLKSKKGFTLIELMVVIVIIGILVAIALPNFISAQDRAKISSVKANMHTLQTQLETYSVDWGGQYSVDDAALKTEATVKKYWKDLKNPFNSSSLALATGERTQVMTTVAGPTGTVPGTIPTGGVQGTTVYSPYDTTNKARTATDASLTAYNIYGVSKEGNTYIGEKNILFTLTNG